MTSAGLPYDSPSPSAIQEPTLLDRPLDDAVHSRAGELLGRMGTGKVYLLEESPALLHLNENELKPRTRRTAKQFEGVDVEAWLTEVSAAAASRIRPTALLLSGEPLAHLSTAKVFSYATGLGAAPLGIEWINDNNLVLIFTDAQAALLAISVLAKAGFDFEDDPLESRSAHHVPAALLPLPENRTNQERLATTSRSRHEPAPLAPVQQEDEDLPPGLRPYARMDVRFAMESDVKSRGKASESKWYATNGRGAGKEQASERQFGSDYDPDASWSRNVPEHERSNGNALLRRMGNERGVGSGRGGGRNKETPYARPGARKRPQVTQDDLDRELDSLRSGGVQAGTLPVRDEDAMDVDEGVGARAPARPYGREGRGGRGGRDRGAGRGKDDLDRELDEMVAGRSAS